MGVWMLPFIGFVVGLLSALLGIGGGALIVPTLVFLYNFSMPFAVGTSLGQITLTALSGTIKHIELKNVNFKVTGIALIGTVLGSISVAYGIVHLYSDIATKKIVEHYITISLTILLVVMGIRMLSEKSKEEEKVRVKEIEKKKYFWLFLIALLIGIIGGSCGIGGGVLLVPTYIYFLGLEPRVAVGTSTLNVFLVGLTSSSIYYFNGFTKLHFVLLIAIGSIIGARVGASLTHKIPGYKIKRFFGVFVLFMAVLLFLKKVLYVL